MTQTPVQRPEHLLEDLTRHYRRHLQEYDRWLRAAESSFAKLTAGELDDFLQLHEQKQAIVGGLREDESSLRRQRDRTAAGLGLDTFTLQGLDEAARSAPDNEDFSAAVAAWGNLLQELDRTMQQVAKVERQIEGKLREHLRTLSESISDARVTRRAVRAYYPEGDAHDAKFIDRKG